MTAQHDPSTTPLGVLDVIAISEGQTPGEAIADSLAVARHAEQAGYGRYWLTEHHLNEGIAGSAITTLLPVFAERTERIRIGTAATLLGNYHLVQVAEAFGALSALYPGRIDLGLGRSGSIPAVSPESAAAPLVPAPDDRANLDAPQGNRIVDGLVVPPKRDLFQGLRKRFALSQRLFRRTAGDTAGLEEAVAELRALFAGTSVDEDAGPYVAPPANGARPELWVHGSSAGISARVAGRLGLPFGSNYHVSPATTLEAVAEYRRHFRPSEGLREPYVIVAADALAADTESEARRLAEGYGHWVASIRAPEGRGAIPYPDPERAAAQPLSPAELERVRDRLDTRFTGAPEQVVEGLSTLRRVTGADELLVTTTAHAVADRVRSFELLAEAWSRTPAVG